MFRGEQEISINNSLELVYQTACSYPCFVSFFEKDSKILKETQNEVEVEVHTKLLGIYRTSWKGTGVKTQNKKIAFLQTKGLFEGLTADWEFESIQGATKVTITTKFSKPHLPKFVETLLGKCIVEKTTSKILSELKSAADREKKYNE